MTWLQSDDNRLSDLFDLAQRATDSELAALSVEDRQKVVELRFLLDLIDAAWQAPEAAVDRVDALFLRKLAAKDPKHPWIQGSIVHTLGELIRLSGDVPVVLPEPVYTQLTQDPTPVESLIDPDTRVRAVGEAAQRAAVPRTLIGDFVLWLNRIIANLVPSAEPSMRGLILTRRQNNQKGKRTE